VPIYFLDSSALVKAYRREGGTPVVLQLLNGSDSLVIAGLAQVEVTAAIVRRGRAATVSAHDIDIVLSELGREISELFEVVDLTEVVIASAVDLARRHALRGADAIQLACALSISRREPHQALIVVSSDRELNAAVSVEGLSILDPV
jgi:predicted nucleic acid-binding protein